MAAPSEREREAFRFAEREIARRRDPALAIPQVPRPTWVTGWLGCGGAQVATLRWAASLPTWLRERSRVWVREWPAEGWPLARAAALHEHTPPILDEAPQDTTHWLLSATPEPELESDDAVAVLLHSPDLWQHQVLYPTLRGATCFGVAHAVREALHPWLEDHGHHWAGVLPPVVPTPVSARIPPEEGPTRAVFVGRASCAKGFGVLVDILAEAPDLTVDAWLAESGDQAEPQAYLEEQLARAESLGVRGRLVVHPTRYALHHVSPLYERADVLLLPSLSEGRPLVIAEALAHGVPVVATRVGGVPELVQEGRTGALLPVGSPAGAWRDAIRRAAHCAPWHCRAQVADYLQPQWSWQHLPGLLRWLGAELHPPEPAQVTVVVIHPADATLADLDHAMACVAQQTHRAFRVVLAAQGSDLHAATLARRYGGVGWTSSQDGGPGEALERALRVAQGTQYMAVLGHGETWRRGFLARAVTLLRELPAHRYLLPNLCSRVERTGAPGDAVHAFADGAAVPLAFRN